jgi:ABC-type siderophore export system fused ATPase/permease subunit
LTNDVSLVTWPVQCLAKLAMNGSVLLGSSVYLMWSSWQIYVRAAAAMLLVAFVFTLLYDRAFIEMRAARVHAGAACFAISRASSRS